MGNQTINKVLIQGRLGKDPELKYTSTGTPVCSFSMATNEGYKDKAGEWQQLTEWHRVVIWGKLGESAASHMRKGTLVFVDGRNQTRKWDKDGQTHYATDVVAQRFQIIDGGKDANDRDTGQGDDFSGAGPVPASSGAGAFDDIPF